MRSAARVLAVWLTPVALLAVPAALCGRAADGLWLGLAWALVPLIVLGLQTGPRPAGAGRDERGSLFPVVTLLLTVGVLLWANVALRRSTVAPGHGVAGLVYLPIDLKARYLWIHVRAGGQTFPFGFRQTVRQIRNGGTGASSANPE